MGINILAYVLSKQYTDKVAVGLGGLKGANCIIDSIVHQNGVSIVTFKWTGTDGTVETDSIEVKDGTPIYPWQSGEYYESGSIAIYNDAFYMCVQSNSDTTFNPSKWTGINVPDGVFGLVDTVDELPSGLPVADKKMYYVIEKGFFYLWNNQTWTPQIETADIVFNDFKGV